MSLRDYGPDSPEAEGGADRTYVSRAALIDGFDFDWRKRRIPRSTAATTDLTHWLALEVALAAVDHARIDVGQIDRQRVAVIVGNSMNGEISRANLLRLRWPYVRNSLTRAFADTGFAGPESGEILRRAERFFKEPFPEPDEDLLAGALSNVIAGRIANYLDLRGGAFVVDGACASSLLAIAMACDGIAAGRWDMVIAGGVDISLDPLELVGFARVGAMSRGTMRVYDERSDGFLPGEGAGFVVLESAESAARSGRQPWATVNGWGLSSDGAGGITAPSPSGQAAAMRRAYEQAGYPMGAVRFVEGHGTGTPVGDGVELAAMQEVVGPRPPGDVRPIGVTSAKTLFGHTKAASGVAGFIKTVLAVNQRVLPPLPRTDRPHERLCHDQSAFYALAAGEVLPAGDTVRAAVSGAGFGGINCHITVSSPHGGPVDLGGPDAAHLLASHQSAELLLVRAGSPGELDQVLAALQGDCAGISDGELTDMCAEAVRRLGGGGWRAAVVAVDAEDLLSKLADARAALAGLAAKTFAAVQHGAVIVGYAAAPPRVGFLLPGQGAQFLGMGSRLTARFASAADRLARWDGAFPAGMDEGLRARIVRPLARVADAGTLAQWKLALRDTRWAQPAVALTALNWAARLESLGVRPDVVAGHSLGELPALALAGAIDEAELIDILAVRSRAAAGDGEAGVMSSLACSAEQAAALAGAAPGYCVVANHNAADLSVVAGAPDAVAAVERSAAQAGIAAIRLDVSNAFHSRYMAPASQALAELGGRIKGARRARVPFVAGQDGQLIDGAIDVAAYASAQVLAPVRYVETVTRLAGLCDVLVELGPGQVQTGLVKRILGPEAAVFAVEPGQDGADRAFCVTLGQLFVRGCAVRTEALFEARFVRPFVPARDRSFIANPCESMAGSVPAAAGRVPAAAGRVPAAAGSVPAALPAARPAARPIAPEAPDPAATDGLGALRRIVAEITGYGEDMVEPHARLGGDLHLDSIKIAEVGAKLARLGWSGTPRLLLQSGTVGEIAATLQLGSQVPGTGPAAAPQTAIVMDDLPVHDFTLDWTPVAVAERCSANAVQGPILLFFEPRHGAEALRLSTALAASRQTCLLLPWYPGQAAAAVPGGGVVRLVALLPPAAGEDPGLAKAMAAYLVALGHLLAGGVQELLIVALHGGGLDAPSALLPIDGLGLGATVLLEGLARQVRVLRLTDVPDDVSALRTPAQEPLEFLRMTRAGALQRAQLRPVLNEAAAGTIPLRDGDLVLVTGGLRGITAECILGLARGRTLRFLVVGRTAADALDAESAANLARLTAVSAEVVYVGCDVADAPAVRRLIQPRLAAMGMLRGIVHGAGVNAPAPLDRLDQAQVQREIAIKSTGLANLLALADPAELRLCVGLGSVIAVTGMHGNAGYALANEMMAAQLARLQLAYPHITVACPAFGVWRDVGMGARLASAGLLSDLAGAGIDPPAGVDAFLRAAGGGSQQCPVVVARPMPGLATWRHLRAAAPSLDARFLRPLLVHEPGLALLSRPELVREVDRYLDHHRFNGTVLFPTVFAIEAFVSAAIELGALESGMPVTISGLVLTRPIVVEDGAVRTIELDARRQAGNPRQVRAVIGEPGQAVAEPIFAGTVAAAEGAMRHTGAMEVAGDEPARELSDHLYAGLLFQGPSFQRIEHVLRFDLADPVCRAGWFRVRRAPAAAYHSADPFFIDALLQTAQVLVPQDVCLPRAIARVTLGPALRRAGPALVEARITARTADGYICQVTATDPDDGALVACLEGYDVGIVEHRAERPTLACLLDPLRFDAPRLDAAMARLRQLGLDPACGAASTGLGGGDGRSERRRRAQDLVAGLFPAPGGGAAAQLQWDGDGRPVLSGAPRHGVGVSHAGGRMIVVRGPSGIACDLEQARGRSRDDWAAMLPSVYHDVLPELASRLASPDLAATVLWAAHECLVKAGNHGASLRIVQADGAGVVLATGGARQDRVFATTLDLALAGRCALAVLVPGIANAAAAPERIFRHGFRPTFGDITTPQRSVAAHSVFRWLGEARELAMASIHAPLAAAFAPAAGHAMLTNFSEVELHTPVHFGQAIEVTVWLDRILDEQPSTFELGFVWRTAQDGPAPAAPLVTARQRLTWVRTRDGHVFRPEPFPAFFDDFLDARRLGRDDVAAVFGVAGQPIRFTDAPRWRKAAHAPDRAAPAILALDTDLSHSNYVGNIYFSHYATLFERTALRLAGAIPAAEGMRRLALASLRVDHLGEAMPGDRLVASVELDEVGARSIALSGHFTNQTQGSGTVAVGRARLRPLVATDDGARWGGAAAFPALETAVA